MSDLIDLLETEFFQTGLRMGLICLGVGFLLVLVLRGWRPLPIAGVLIAVAVMAALWRLEALERSEIMGAVAIVVGVFLARLSRASPIVVALASAPGAIWLAFETDVTDTTWVRLAMAVLIPVCGYLITDFELRYAGMGLGLIFFTLAAMGVFLAVPDTEWPLVLLAAAVPLTFLAWPLVRIALGVEGAYAAVTVFVLVTAQGGVERSASVVGGLACLGVLLIEPVLLEFRPGIVRLTSWPNRDWKGAIVASVPQLVVVAVCSRIAARFTDELPALIVVALIYAFMVAIAVSASREEADPRVA